MTQEDESLPMPEATEAPDVEKRGARTRPTPTADKVLARLVRVDARLKKKQAEVDDLILLRVRTINECIENGVTYRRMGDALGISEQGVYAILKRQREFAAKRAARG